MSDIEKLLAVKDAADMVVTIIGAQGEIDSRHGAVQKLLDAIHDAERMEVTNFMCHVDGGFDPHCVFDAGRQDDCSISARISKKEDCPYWRPITK